MQQRSLAHMIFLSSLSIVPLASCKREKEPDYHSAAYQIAKSEELLIPATVTLPDNPKGNSRVATYYAIGVQKYKATPKTGGNSNEFQWTLAGPQADLYDASNKKVGTHSFGPTWQLTGTADSIFGAHFTTPKIAASPDPNAIDWLLLTIKKQPTGLFQNVVYIQRIATKGGKAPATAPAKITDTVDVKYTAVYRFSRVNQ